MSRTEEKRAAFSLAPWKRLWRCVCQHRLRLALAIGSNLLLAVADFYIPLLQSRVVDQFILTGTTAGFGGYAVKYIGVCLFEIAMLLVYFKACMGLEMLSGRDMKEACFVNLQKLSLDYYNVTSAGHTLSRVMSDTDRIATCIAWVFPDILWGFAYILGVLGVMLSLSPGLAMTIIVIAPIVTALTVYFQKKLIVLNRDVRAQHSKITSSYNEGIMGAKTSKTLALEERLTDEFEQTTAQAAKAGILHGRMRAIYVPLIVLCGTLAASATLLRGEIDFDDVSFTYPDGGEEVLTHFSLHVPAGSTVAIVGETGAGKSTLVNLVCRFYEPTSGRVLIDGRDARERSQLWLHSNIGYVLQTPHLFSGTVLENLRYGRENATMGEIEAAVRAVSAEGIIERLPDGYQSDVGEGGNSLSTGEKQLLSFARAILADPRILVLDEATASVDTITEQKIQSAIDTIIRGRTSVVIAHRLSTVRNADLILVVDDGKIIEQGTHEQLMSRRGSYYRLYTRQYEDEATSRLLS